MRSARRATDEPPPAAAGPAALRGEVQYAHRPENVPGPILLRRWARAAHAAGVVATRARGRAAADAVAAATAGAVTVRIVGGTESRRLNRAYRGKDAPTNVLSFPASAEERRHAAALGDLVVCAPVVAREAREQRKSPRAHWAHMVVHGVLHLLGYDHENDRDAEFMESREVKILSQFGYANPYG